MPQISQILSDYAKRKEMKMEKSFESVKSAAKKIRP
jgi:hypothetical protein